MSFVTVPSMSEISYISKEHGTGRFAQAYALFNMAFSAGFLIGSLWGGLVTEAAGWDTMVTSLAGLVLISIPPVVLWTGGPINPMLFRRKRLDKEKYSQDMQNAII